jgi:hypothetical protein
MRSDEAQGDTYERDLAVALGVDTDTRVRAFVYRERWTWASFLLHAVGLACMTLLPPQSSALALDMLSEDAHYARYLATPIERDESLDLGLFEGSESAQKAADSEGQAGKPDAPHKTRRMSGGHKLAVDANGSAREQNMDGDPRVSAREAGILGVLSRQALALSGPGSFDVAGAGDGSLPALGAILGSQVGDSFGFNGLGMRGTGRGGGGDVAGSIGVGGFARMGGGGPGNCRDCVPTLKGQSHEARVPRLRTGTVETQGALAKEVIRRVIQRHLNEVRFCYEENLRKAPELAGRVEVKFVISPSGAVHAASVAASTLVGDGARTAQCITDAVRRFSFPAPEGGGVVIVTYPFLLQAPQ